ncbi:SLATT domain-containing protein [Paraburkholderia adhaesiva]|uniref:SLATT domain-containing protein n=1 Tax=Paraburkholderia adhaesiva TaxID=2883244 RepID=UPI001F2D40A8|nr:SLATT domain-containing protein [Paraburkholderia adhaesiva]
MDAVEACKTALRAKIEADRDRSNRYAWRFALWLALWKWATIVSSGISVTLGIVASVKPFPLNPAVFSAIAAVTAGLAALQQKFSWREQSDAYYARADRLDKLLDQLDYELPVEITLEQVALISRRYDEVRREIGDRIFAINRQEDARWTAAPSAKGHNASDLPDHTV